MFLQRVEHYVTQKILEDDAFDIFTLIARNISENDDIDPDEEILDGPQAEAFEDLNAKNTKPNEIVEKSYEQGTVSDISPYY